MSRIYITNRNGRYLALEYDDVADEVTDLLFGNLTAEPWQIKYQYRNDLLRTYTVPAQTEDSVAIPPGQRRFVPATATYKYGYESEIQGMTY